MTLPSIEGYTITERLGTGGFASVYLASNDDDGQLAAIKVLHAHSTDASDLRRFERERMTMQAFGNHPHIVSVFDSGETEGSEHYMVLEYVDGGSVRDLLKDRGALHWSDALRIAVQICSALDVAHRSGVLHRDVKPGNVLLKDDNAKLTDFGIARLIGQSQVTAAQSIIGTLAYTPPEVFHDRGFDGRGDIYQLGITMYEMLLGRAPFTSAAADNKATIIRRILDKPAPSIAPFDVPQPISDLLDEVLSKDPADRPQSVERLGQRLNEIERELGRTPTPMYREDEDSADSQGLTTDHPGGIDTIQAPTMPIDMQAEMGQNPTVDVGSSPESVWPAAAGSAVLAGRDADELATPTPPVVTPPDDYNVTVAEPRPVDATSVIEERASVKVSNDRADESPAVEVEQPNEQAPEPAEPAKAGRSRAPWLVLLLGLIIAGGVGALFLLSGFGDEPNGGTVTGEVEDPPVEDDSEETPETNEGEGESETNEGEGEGESEGEGDEDDGPAAVVDERSPEFAPVDSEAFSEPEGTDGVIFGSVANSQGLTMVGSAGDGERVSDQRSIVWTLGTNGFAVQRDFDESGAHRMWSVGVIDGETFLAVGDGPGVDGVAWTGTQAGSFGQVSNDDFTGAANDQLRVSIADPTQENTFLVGGSRSVGSAAVTALWEVTGEPSWQDPTWTRVDLGDVTTGVINDIAVDGEIAVAVGMETTNSQEAGTILIRRGETWSNLIQPQPNVQFFGVTISDGQIIAVGEQNTDAFPTPVAVTSDADGVGLIHVLPIRAEDGGIETGIARAVTALADGTILAVGDVDRRLDPEDAESDTDRDGAIWQYLPNEEVWTTRASPDLVVDGFTELWTINEWDGEVFVFGRTDTTDDRQPAGAWTLDLN